MEMNSSRYQGSATTQTITHHVHSAASNNTKYGTISSAECCRSSFAKTIEVTTEVKKVKAISVNNIENDGILVFVLDGQMVLGSIRKLTVLNMNMNWNWNLSQCLELGRHHIRLWQI